MGFDERDKDLPALFVDVDELQTDARIFVMNSMDIDADNFTYDVNRIRESRHMEEEVNGIVDLMGASCPDKHALSADVFRIFDNEIIIGLVGDLQGHGEAVINPLIRGCQHDFLDRFDRYQDTA